MRSRKSCQSAVKGESLKPFLILSFVLFCCVYTFDNTLPAAYTTAKQRLAPYRRQAQNLMPSFEVVRTDGRFEFVLFRRDGRPTVGGVTRLSRDVIDSSQRNASAVILSCFPPLFTGQRGCRPTGRRTKQKFTTAEGCMYIALSRTPRRTSDRAVGVLHVRKAQNIVTLVDQEIALYNPRLLLDRCLPRQFRAGLLNCYFFKSALCGINPLRF